MPKRMNLLGALLSLSAALALAGCATSGSRGTIAQGGAREALLETDRAFARLAAQKGVAEAFYAYATEEATMFPVGELPVQGRDAIRVAMAAGPEGQLRWTPRHAQVSDDGTLGYTWGFYEFQGSEPDGQPVLRHGKYLTVWIRTKEGSWKFVADIGNLGPPPRESSR